MSEAPTPRWRQWGRRVSFWVLLAAILFMVLRILQTYPVEVEVSYHYGAAREGLVRAMMTYRGDDGAQLRRVRFGYGGQPCPSTQRHVVKLPRGEYQIAIELEFRGRPDGALPGRRVGETKVRLDRPLIVKGEGQVSVFIVD